MNRKLIVILASCLFFSTALVVMLYALSEKIVHQPNSFLRKYIPHMAEKLNELDLKYNSYYIAGMCADRVYLGNRTNPLHLLSADVVNLDSQHVQLDLKAPGYSNFMTVRIDSPYFYLMDGIMPGFFRGEVGEWQANKINSDSVYFNQSVPISPSSFAITTTLNNINESELGKVSSTGFELDSTLLQKQVDGLFCCDGLLYYSKKLNRLIYTYRYRNEFIIYDTNLNLDYRGHTIDTFSRAQVKVVSIKSENKQVLAAGSKVVNKTSCVSGNYLFINSALLAKNDSKELFEKVSVIDVYDLKNNSYKFSLYIPNYKGEKKITEFKVFNNRILIAIHDRHVVTYSLKSNFF